MQIESQIFSFLITWICSISSQMHQFTCKIVLKIFFWSETQPTLRKRRDRKNFVSVTSPQCIVKSASFCVMTSLLLFSTSSQSYQLWNATNGENERCRRRSDSALKILPQQTGFQIKHDLGFARAKHFSVSSHPGNYAGGRGALCVAGRRLAELHCRSGGWPGADQAHRAPTLVHC